MKMKLASMLLAGASLMTAFSAQAADKVTLLEVPAMAISSTDCRQRVRSGKPVWYLVPDGVVQYIGKYDLYRD